MTQQQQQQPVRRWQIFCRVVDNFGDIGVCWRLAQQLAREHGQQVQLWVDDLHSFVALQPQLNPQLASQWLTPTRTGGQASDQPAHCPAVQVLQWQQPFRWLDAEPQASVVIEAFGCQLPAEVISQMQQAGSELLWLNLEYLSAEPWVVDFHAAPSPLQGLTRYFFMPGFAAGTGGLLYEPQLAALPAQMASPLAFADWLESLQLPPQTARQLAQIDCRVSLFGYENPALPELLDSWQATTLPVLLLVPQSKISSGVEQWLGQALPVGESQQRGALTLLALPFMSQLDYDRLLAASSINLVRGEESFVRSQILGKPTLWHIYPQQQLAHLDKLEAFLNLYQQGMPAELARALKTASLRWNGDPEQPTTTSKCWDQLLFWLPEWQKHAEDWKKHCLAHGDLATNLVKFRPNEYSCAAFSHRNDWPCAW
ncbi:elongation factor P maturation arginine rhamnosyltransferase EarP [Oceanobacter mangrovi]|uniref:elongation factor P maturation arginine rhamnosyltransferase EarP n=1 Tax=Oceanobacter mangrovi TaxID=2862510 RepID=UPI001C8D4E01|nr:elongation factor P maturation arginine rhamnosyltransferase EarP [Oceanobacter mangrovi]